MLTQTHRILITASIVSFAFAQTGQAMGNKSDDQVRLNEIQIIGTHNSYHAGLAPSEALLLASTDPPEAMALDYRHPSLPLQLEAGNRELELDVYPDPTGGQYKSPKGLTDVVNAGLAPDDPHFYKDGVMLKPGFKVMHKPDADYRSNCQPFTECLQEIHAWSKAHPEHIPIFLFIETKVPTRLKPADLDVLEDEVRSVFSASEMITPEDVLGKHPSLHDAIRTEGWPTLKQSRGKVMFLMAREEITEMYRAGHPHFKGRIMFVNGRLDDPDTVFTVQPKNRDDRIQRLVRDGLLVYTRCDADTTEARNGDSRRREAAFASGAQILTTDYPASEPSHWNKYTVEFPRHTVARCNPVVRAQACSDDALEPRHMEATESTPESLSKRSSR